MKNLVHNKHTVGPWQLQHKFYFYQKWWIFKKIKKFIRNFFWVKENEEFLWEIFWKYSILGLESSILINYATNVYWSRPCTIVVRAYFALEGLKSALHTSHLTILTLMFAISESFFPDISKQIKHCQQILQDCAGFPVVRQINFIKEFNLSKKVLTIDL